MQNRLMRLIGAHQKGNRPTFHLGPFLPISLVQNRGLLFNDVFREPVSMAAAAHMNFELGFESAVLPFDMNVEAEMLGAEVRYHEGFEGHPVYPTIGGRPVAHAEDVAVPNQMASSGRLSAVLEAVSMLKETDSAKGAVGAFLPGPFTLAGQVMEPEKLFMMLLKKPDEAEEILKRLSEFINALKNLYGKNRIDFVVVEEGGASSISPQMFGRLLLPHLQAVFVEKPCPMALSMVGGSEQLFDFLLACDADGVQIDRECDTLKARNRMPDHMPLFTGCGSNDLLGTGNPETIAMAVRSRLDQGATGVAPPADIYPAAKMENIAAFIEALRRYEQA